MRNQLIPDLAVRLLGGAAIEQAGQPLAQRAAHRHGLGLLALLAATRGRLMSRDKVLALLWPEGEPESVRHRLNVVLYELRRILGKDAILSINDDLRLHPELVWVDVLRFGAAIERGEHAEALALYRGPFLDGLYLPDAPEFERWIDGERDRLARQALGLAEALAQRAHDGADFRLAAQHWRRGIELDPLASRPVVGLMNALAELGESAEVSRAAEQHAARRAEQLEAAPDPAVQQRAEELRRIRASTPTPRSPQPDEPAGSPGQDAAAAPPVRRPGRPAQRRAMVLLAIPLVLLLVLLPQFFSGSTAEAGNAAVSRLVIFPFQVRGSDRIAYLGDGMVELLTITLDGAGSIRTADPHAVLSFLRRSATPSPPEDPAMARQVAARFDAAHFVLGTIVESGNRLEIQASLYDAEGRHQVRAVAAAGDDGDIMGAVDALTRQLISARYQSGADRLARLATTTTMSLPALKAYLEGEALLRGGEHQSAADAFRRAVGQDSSFALAWYRLAVASEWALQPRDALAAVEGAVRHAARLPQRDSLLLVGWRAYARGDAELAEAVYRRVLDLYPTETEAWLQLGEIGFHYGASRGVGIGSARPAFEAVLELDPDHEGALVHLARITAEAGDTPALVRYVDHLLSREPAAGVALELRTLKAFATGDRSAIRELRSAYRREDSYAVMGALLSLFHAGNLDGVAWCAELLRDAERPREVRTAGHLTAGLIELARGRRDRALGEVTRAEALDSVRGLELRGIIAMAPFLPADSAESRRVRRALEARLARETTAPVAESFFLPDPDGVRPLLWRYLLGLLSAQLGDGAAAAGYAEELERARSPAADSVLGADLALGVRAEVLRLAGNEAEALATLEKIRERPRYQLVLPSPFDPRVRERYLRALLEKKVRGQPAGAWSGTIGRRSVYDLPYRAQ